MQIRHIVFHSLFPPKWQTHLTVSIGVAYKRGHKSGRTKLQIKTKTDNLVSSEEYQSNDPRATNWKQLVKLSYSFNKYLLKHMGILLSLSN